MQTLLHLRKKKQKKLFTMKEVGATMQTLLHLRKKSRKNYLQ